MFLTELSAILALLNPSIDSFKLHQICRSKDFRGLYLWKGRSCSHVVNIEKSINISTFLTDRPFHNFGAFKSVTFRSWATLNSLMDGFLGYKIVKGSIWYPVLSNEANVPLITRLNWQPACSSRFFFTEWRSLVGALFVVCVSGNGKNNQRVSYFYPRHLSSQLARFGHISVHCLSTALCSMFASSSVVSHDL